MITKNNSRRKLLEELRSEGTAEEVAPNRPVAPPRLLLISLLLLN